MPERAIGFAGMKDKAAVTEQTVSILLHHDPGTIDLGHDRIEVLWVDRHRNALRRGHLAGNRFRVRIRGLAGVPAEEARAILDDLERHGVPNWFGEQRFGYRLNNHRLGAFLLGKDHVELLGELLGAGGSPAPAYQQERRSRFDAGAHAEALACWTGADAAERSALRVLSRGGDATEACLAIPIRMRRFWINALQSAVFNRVLDDRVSAGTRGVLLVGDLAWKHDSRAVFAVDEDVLTDPDTTRRLRSLEISPSGPLWGPRMMEASGAVHVAERAALEAVGIERADLGASRPSPQGSRRPLRVPLLDVHVEPVEDEAGPALEVAFSLSRGAYATVVLREVMKADAAP